MDAQIKVLKAFEEEYWITKDKQKVKIKDLTLNHLGNIVKFLQKKFDSLEDPLNDYPSFQGEMAQMYAEQCWQHEAQRYASLERRLKLFKVYYKLKSL